MPQVTLNGGVVVYEMVGDANQPVIVLTPGGRFGKDIPGLRPLADALVGGGYQVLLWDRPNCGASDVQLYGITESHMRAETLHLLIETLQLGPCVLAGGSGGARDTLLTAILYPQTASRLMLWSIVGGVYGMLNLAGVYVLPSLQAVRIGGMHAVIEQPEWKALIEANPHNRERLLAFDEDGFTKVMLRWLLAFVPRPGQTLPGVEDWMFDDIKVPTLIIKGGATDLSHPLRTSLELHTLIASSMLVDAPWPEPTWSPSARPGGRFSTFDSWVLAAPSMLTFLGR